MESRRSRTPFGATMVRAIVPLIALALGLGASLLIKRSFFDACQIGRFGLGRANADMRVLATALEAYCAEHGSYPRMVPLRMMAGDPGKLRIAGAWTLSTYDLGSSRSPGLMTPVRYLARPPLDPFSATLERGSHYKSAESISPYAYYATPDRSGWILFSPGPDGAYDIADPAAVYNIWESNSKPGLINLRYDPTNGPASNGDVYRVKQ